MEDTQLPFLKSCAVGIQALRKPNVRSALIVSLVQPLVVVLVVAGICALDAFKDSFRELVFGSSDEPWRMIFFIGMLVSVWAQTAVSEYYQDRGIWPDGNAGANSAGLAPAANIIGKYVTSVSVGSVDGVITVTYGNDAHASITGNTLTLTAADNIGSISWTCASSVLADKHLPAACR